MTVVPKQQSATGFDARRLALIKKMNEIDATAGIIGKPTLTPEQLQERQRANGIRPEDRVGSRELIQMRYGDEREEA